MKCTQGFEHPRARKNAARLTLVAMVASVIGAAPHASAATEAGTESAASVATPAIEQTAFIEAIERAMSIDDEPGPIPHIAAIGRTGASELMPLAEVEAATVTLPENGDFIISMSGDLTRVGTNGSIVFEYVDGGTRQRGVHPRWSPDGSQIAFTNSYYNATEILVMNADGSDLRTVVTGEGLRGLSWSPDASRLAYFSYDEPCHDGGTGHRVSIVDVETGSVQAVTDPLLVEAGGGAATGETWCRRMGNATSWSPDGSLIAFTSHDTRESLDDWWLSHNTTAHMDDGNLVLVDVASHVEVNLTWPGYVQFDWPDFSPDGSLVVMSGDDDVYSTDESTYIFTIPVSGGLNDLVQLADTGLNAFEPVWSPDGTRVSFLNTNPSDGNTYLASVDAIGGNPTVHLGPVGAIGYDWAPAATPAPQNHAPGIDSVGPFTTAEGETLDLAVVASDPDDDTLDIAWDLDSDGDFDDASGPEPSVGWSALEAIGIDDGPASFDISVRVSDGEDTVVGDTTLLILNAAPEAAIGVDQIGAAGAATTITLTGLDPSAMDVDTMAWMVAWGDGTTEAFQGATVEATHTYAAPGPVTVTVIAIDKDDGESAPATAQITIEPNDDPPGPTTDATEFRRGYGELLNTIDDWLREFNLGDAGADDQPPVVTPDLADHFGLGDIDSSELGLSPIAVGTDTMAELCADLVQHGFTIDWIAGGACGGSAPTGLGDVIQVRSAPMSLLDLARAGGFAGDPFNDATDGVLQSLAEALDLDSSGGWNADLFVQLVIGVDADGFYVAGETELRLDVSGDVALGGSGTIGAGTAAIDGTAEADLTVILEPLAARQRQLDTAVEPRLAGAAAMTLDFASGPLTLDWDGQWTADASGATAGPQRLQGTLSLPGLDDGGTVAALAASGVLDGNVWHVTGSSDLAGDSTIAGFRIDGLDFSADIGPASIAGTASAALTAAVPGGDRTIALTIDFDRDSWSVDGVLQLPELSLGDPALLHLDDAFLHAHFTAALPAGPLTGSVEIGADAAVVLPADPVGDATTLIGTIDHAGALTLQAATMHASIADGAIVAQLADAAFRIGPGTGPNLLEVATASATFPALGDLEITFTDLFLTKAGVFGASAVHVATHELDETIGLGGVLPFEVTDVTVVFPDPADLDRFEVAVVGRFDFSAFPDLGPTFVPRVGLGGPVVTPDTPPEDNRFSFSVDVVSLADGIVLPLDVTAITFGFDGLQAGDVVIGADLTLGGYVDGVFQESIGGELRVDGPSASLLDELAVTLDGNLHPGPPVALDVAGSVGLSGTFGSLTLTDVVLEAGLNIAQFEDGLTIEPRLVGLDVGEASFAFGDLMTLHAGDARIDLAPEPGGNIVEIGNDDGAGLTVEFDQSIAALDNWSGTFANVALGDDFLPRLLPGFAIDIAAPGSQFGLPDFIPLHIDGLGVTFPQLGEIPSDGLRLTADSFDGMRVRMSGGIVATTTWPIAAAVDGLEIDLARLIAGDLPITNLDGFLMGVEPFTLPGDVTIGGGLAIGTVDVDGKQVFYGRIFGELAAAGIGAGVDLVVTQYGPVLMKVRAPLGIPLGPTGILLAGVEGAAQFGDVTIPVPPVGDATALLDTLTLPTDLRIDQQVIADAIRPVVHDRDYTWDHGFALSLAGDLTVAAAPGVLSGRVTIGMNLGHGVGPTDPPGVQLVGRGEITAYGIPLGQAGLLIDLRDLLAPSIDLAFASPVPGSPLALVMPARATFGVQLRTDGVMLGTIAGLRAFSERVLAGSLVAAGDLFDAVLDEMAVRLDADRSRPLAALLLDLDADREVEPSEQRIITRAFILDRLIGRNGLPALLPASVDQAGLARAADVATALLDELMFLAGQLLADPARTAEFDVSGADALASIAEVIRVATADALVAFGQRFNPTFSIEGELQPTFFGLPVGSPDVKAELMIDRNGLFFELEGSLVSIGKQAMANTFPLAAPGIDAALTVATLGVEDRFHVGARLPFGGVVDALVTGASLPTFQPLDPNWAVTIGGTIDVYGYEVAELSGIAFLPNQGTFLNSRVQKLYTLPAGTPIDPTRIPLTTKAHYDALVKYGGILVTGSLRVPRLVTDPGAVLAAFPPVPEDPFAYLAWLDDLAAATGAVDTPARVQFFIPGIAAVGDNASAVAWAGSPYLEGVWDGKLLGMGIGRGTMLLTPEGLDVTSQLPLIATQATVTLNTATLSGGDELPTAGLDVALGATQVRDTLTRLGVPATFLPAVQAEGRFRAYTPGFDPDSSERIERNGGIELTAVLDAAGFVDDAGFRFAISPRSGGFDVHGTASVATIVPFPGVSITNATVTIDVVRGAAGVTVNGSANVLGAVASVSGTLKPDLTGTLTFTISTGQMQLGGSKLSGAASLSLKRTNGQLVASIGILGDAIVPEWLKDATDTARLGVAACVDSTGNAELQFDLPTLRFGPTELVRVGRNPSQVALEPGPATCTLPAGAPVQQPTGPLFRMRVTGGVVSAVVDGSVEFPASGAVAGLSVRGSFNGSTGAGLLAVAFAQGRINLSGFAVDGSATMTIGTDSFSMAITGTLSVPGIVSAAAVGGTATENGITRLTLTASALTLPPLTVNSFSATLDRTAASTYRLVVSANVSFPGIPSPLVVSGSLDSTGNGNLAIATPSLTINGASITDGQFALVRSAGTTRLSARGRFALFGTSLEVVQADLAVAPVTGISGSLVIRAFGGGTLTIGGFTIGGTLSLGFANGASRISIAGGTVAINGWGTVGITADIPVPVQNGAFFQLTIPAGGMRLGAPISPFFASGTFRLSLNNNVVSLSAVNVSVAWKDGTATIATMTAPSITIGSNGLITAALNSFNAATAAGFSFTVPSVNLAIDPGGLNARLSLGVGSVRIPALPALATPPFNIGTTPSFSQPLVTDALDLGIFTLHGRLLFERQGGVFRLRLTNTTTGVAPSFELEEVTTVPLPAFTVAPDGTFVVDAAMPSFGPATFRIVGAQLHIARDQAGFQGRITNGSLLIDTIEPIGLPALDFGTASRFREEFTFSGWDLGPFLRASTVEVELQHLSTGVVRLRVLNTPTLTAFAGSTSMQLNTLTAADDGTFDGAVSGRLAVFGHLLSTSTFDVSRSGGTVRLTLPASGAATVDLGFEVARVSGFATAAGAFDFDGTASVGVGVTGFSLNGTIGVSVSSAYGIEGSYNGQVCVVGCITTNGSLRSDGRINGLFRVDLNNDGDYRDLGDINAEWFVYLDTGAVRLDINNDNDFNDIGDIVVGTSTVADSTAPSMAVPSNITVRANISASGAVRVYYPYPVTTDAGTTLPATCAPATGSIFYVGTTTVNCRANDAAGNLRTRSFTVTVTRDTTVGAPLEQPTSVTAVVVTP